MKRYPNGEISRYLHRLGAGDKISIRAPSVTWYYRPKDWDEVVFVRSRHSLQLSVVTLMRLWRSRRSQVELELHQLINWFKIHPLPRPLPPHHLFHWSTLPLPRPTYSSNHPSINSLNPRIKSKFNTKWIDSILHKLCNRYCRIRRLEWLIEKCWRREWGRKWKGREEWLSFVVPKGESTSISTYLSRLKGTDRKAKCSLTGWSMRLLDLEGGISRKDRLEGFWKNWVTRIEKLSNYRITLCWLYSIAMIE